MTSDARETRRGALAIGAAKAWFLVVGLGQNVLVPLAIGQGGFGAYKRALAFVSVLNNVLVVASIQAVSRAVAAAPASRRRATMARATFIQSILGFLLGALFLVLTPLIVAHQHAPQLAAPLRLLAGVLVAYGVYAPMVGALNGVRAFGAQAALDATFSTTRTALSIVVGWWFVHRFAGEGAVGATIGFLVAAVAIIPIAWLASRRVKDEPGDEGAAFDVRGHLSFLAGLLAMQTFQSLLLQVDLMVIGRAATLRALAEGATEVAARASADRLAGLYAQAQAFGLVPYQLLIAAGFVLFPAVAAARARGDEEGVRAGVAQGGAATLLVAGALIAALGGAPMAVLRFAFGRGSADGFPLELAAPILRALTVAHGATAIATLGTTLIAASGRGRLAAGLSGIVAGSAWLGTAVGASQGTSLAALGIATSLGLAAGLVFGAVVVVLVVQRVVGPYVRALSALRISLAIAAAFAVGSFVPVPAIRIVAPVAGLAPLAVFLLVATVLGENPRALLGRRVR